MPRETWATTLDVAIALADDAGLQLAVDEGDVVRDLVLESRRGLESLGEVVELTFKHVPVTAAGTRRVPRVPRQAAVGMGAQRRESEGDEQVRRLMDAASNWRVGRCAQRTLVILDECQERLEFFETDLSISIHVSFIDQVHTRFECI